MSTITREFTKEQLIAKAREQIAFCRHTKITGEGRTHVNQCSALFEIALASLEAEPVAECHHQWKSGGANKLQRQKQCVKYGRVELAAPPAPVSVPDAISTRQAIAKMENHEPCDSINVAYKFGWNACRSAMLQGADGNSPVIPDGYALVPIEPTTNQWAAGMQAFDSGMDKVTRVYKAMLTAAPQQEVK
ncbi:hypothetical protein A6J71_00720 [Enterobacter cancerogenus]|uniref:hypothetical protein n=1 Tax=Enterobacter cancerogenus TaxID=69218 RepID=UPI000C9A43D5|nr:hypothetical protein [Enterobacter cancerogenus]PNF10369.1 hypothetical protein A6J71_09495 [Enterobacter cancerogenus]PNF13462.1 hypothetical protein A6J71_00720 [Enterobacter cancerogenus]